MSVTFRNEKGELKVVSSENPLPVAGFSVGGAGGSEFIIKAGAPTSSDGEDGDVYVNADNGQLYEKEDGSWVVKADLKGDKGDKGEKGDTGAKGAKGDDGAKGDKGDDGTSYTESDFLSDLPTADPADNGALWNDGGVVKVSTVE